MEYKNGSPTAAAKDTNPKDAVGTLKVPFSVLPAPVLGEVGLALLEGARKYGRHNYRVSGIRYSVYYDAAIRHLSSWWEGQDNDPDSGLSHITKAIAGLVVLRDAMMTGMVTDDRPPLLHDDWVSSMNKKAAEIISRYPDAKEPYTLFSMAEMAAEYDGPEMSPVDAVTVSHTLASIPQGATIHRCPNGAPHLWDTETAAGQLLCDCGAYLNPGVSPSDLPAEPRNLDTGSNEKVAHRCLNEAPPLWNTKEKVNGTDKNSEGP